MHDRRAALLAACLLISSPAFAGSPVPQFQWASQPLVGTGQSSAHGVAMDHSGNTFVCGQMTDTLNLSTGALVSIGGSGPNNTDAFLVKYATDGTVLWARNGGNSTPGSNESGYGVAVDPAGNAYMTGEYGGATPTSFGGIQIDDTGGGAFAVKYNSGGTVQWATSLSTAGPGNAIATSGTNLVYVFVGSFPNAEIKKLDSANGDVLETWTLTGSISTQQNMAISVDGSGNVIISGHFFGTVDFDPGVGVSNLDGDLFGDGFIAKYSSAGALLWARKLSSDGSDSVKGHALGTGGDVYFCGALESAGTVDGVAANAGDVAGRLDPSGNGVWMRNTVSNFGGSDFILSADRIGVDGNGDYYIIATGLPGTGDIGGFPVPSDQHFHIVKYGAGGAVAWAKFATGSIAFPRAILVTGADLFNVVGGMVSETVFDAFTLPDINGFPREAMFSAQVGDVTSPVLASLATAEASPDRVRITWYVTGLDVAAFVERQRGGEGWEVVGEVTRSGADYVSYDDRDVSPGDRLAYRLAWREGGEVLRSQPVTVMVPARIEGLSLAVGPNPASGFVDALISVPGAGAAAISMHDLQGRRVMERHVEAGAAGRLTVRLSTSELSAGLYWLTLRHGAGAATARVSVVR